MPCGSAQALRHVLPARRGTDSRHGAALVVGSRCTVLGRAPEAPSMAARQLSRLAGGGGARAAVCCPPPPASSNEAYSGSKATGNSVAVSVGGGSTGGEPREGGVEYNRGREGSSQPHITSWQKIACRELAHIHGTAGVQTGWHKEQRRGVQRAARLLGCGMATPGVFGAADTSSLA